MLERVGERPSAQDVLASVQEDVNSHAGGAEQSDDLTMLGLEYCGMKSLG